MAILRLERYAYLEEETLGRLILPDEHGVDPLFTIERPWVPGDAIGGTPYKSCVPDGDYELVPFLRSSGVQTLALLNPALGVYVDQDDGVGRFAILIHAGNWSSDVVGCIAPGTAATIANNRNMVVNSRHAMNILSDCIDFLDTHSLEITPFPGAVDA